MRNNSLMDKFYLTYLIGFFLILTLPLLVAPPWFFPPDWGKTIIFRSIMAVLLFLFAYQFLFKRGEIILPDIKKNKIIWILTALGITILLSVLFSVDSNFSLWGSPYRAGGAINLFFYALFALLGFLVIKKSDWNKVLNFSIGVGILVCAIAIIQLYGLFSTVFIPIPGRPPSTIGNPILLGIYLLLLFFVTASFAIKEHRRNYKFFYYAVLLLFLYVILMTGSRAAYLGLLLGSLYFVLCYPKKLLILKISAIIILLLGVFTIYYVNSTTHFPAFLENNKMFQAIQPRLSLRVALAEPRFSAWKVGVEALKERPILGFGPENFAIGFDKYYDPSLPYISKAWGGWWDRPHNIFLDIATSSGIPSLILYLVLFVTLFWQLSRFRRNCGSLTAPMKSEPSGQKTEQMNGELVIMAHGLQATLIAYLVANTLSFDGFSSYLLFFLLIGYSLHLISQSPANTPLPTQNNIGNVGKNDYRNAPWKKIVIAVLFTALVIFLWQYNLKPLQINAQIQKANFLSESKKCDQAFAILDNILPRHSFLDAYARIKYVEYIKTCAQFFPEKNLAYAQRGVELMKEAVKMRPEYSRLWLFLGSFTTIKANAQQNSDSKKSLIEEADSYLQKASQLAPNHQEVLIEQAKTDMVAGRYQAMKEKAEKCITKDPSLKDCYWTKALSEIYLGDFKKAEEDMQLSGFQTNTVLLLHQLVNAYATIKNYPKLAKIYNQLITLNPNVPEYHASLAFTYANMKEYKKSRQEASIFLQLMPSAKDEVEMFLKTIP